MIESFILRRRHTRFYNRGYRKTTTVVVRLSERIK
jgi:hypothetical protein